MQDLYAQDPGAVQVDEGTGQADYAPTPESVDASAATANAVGMEAAQVNEAAQAAAQTGTTATAEAALSAPGVGDAVDAAVAGQAQGEAGGYDATTASEELLKITGQDSPLMQRAQQRGILSAARRGLQNTTIAGGMAEGAMVDAASPIAIQDANAINQARQFTAQQANEMEALNVQMMQQTGLAGLDARTKAALQDAGLLTQTGQFNTNQINSMEQLNAQLGTQTEQFNAAQRNSIATLNAQLEQDATRFTAAEQNQIAALNAQMETEVSIRNAAAATEASFLDSNLRFQINDANAARQLALAQGNMQEANRQQQFIMDINADLNKQFLAGAQANDLASIQGEYNQLISTNENAARLYEAHFNSISATMANDKLTPARIAGYINVSQRMLTSGLAMMAEMNGIDLGNFTLPTVSGSATTLASYGGSQPGYNQNGEPNYDPDAQPIPIAPEDRVTGISHRGGGGGVNYDSLINAQ